MRPANFIDLTGQPFGRLTVLYRDTSPSKFLHDMGPRPSSKHSIERRNNDGSYSAKNCYWATRQTQARNMRTNALLTWQDETHCLAEWADIIHIQRSILAQRYRAKWSVEKILTTPVRRWPSQR